MSRIGKRPIKLVQDVKVAFNDRLLEVKGPKGELELKTHPEVDLVIENETLSVIPSNEGQSTTAMIGTTWKLINNMIQGVTQGFQKQLNLIGVGYRAAVSQKELVLNLGHSHPIKYTLPEGITAAVNANTKILLESSDKQLLGQVSAEIQKFRPPEPYKGKGVLFEGQKLKRKAGKSGKI
ncbi:MAG: 50S ribosomal protein L6 [Deltaproteobacteria bacterium]|jgi:large subunit ribosomal protein L6|nr:50S ribosomal protein L6 [Deltaproteobacteria bacterium]